jgi:hypothetical protein
MDIQSAALSQLFVLFPVIIPGWIPSVRPPGIAAGGIPHSIYDDRTKGLECLVDPWAEPLMTRTAVDDRVDLYIEGVAAPVDGKTISPGEELLRVRLYVPRGRLRDGVNRLYYRVTRPSGSFEDSRILEVLYHLRAPGAPAPTNTRLQIPADVRSNGVDAERARQGVIFGFDYSNRRAYDLIRLTLGVVQVEREVTPAEAGPGLPVVTQTLFTDTFVQSGDDAQTAVDYSVTDQLGNFNQSTTEYIDVHVSRITLEKAILREILTENNDDPATVDLAKLNGNPLSALIHLVETIWKVGDSIKLLFTAELSGGVVATHEETSPVTQVPSQFVWSIPNSKIIANSTLKVVYQLVRGGTVIATSIPAEAQVVGEGAINLNPPTLLAPAENPIELWLYSNGVTLRIEFLTALAGDKAQLLEINPPAGATPFPEVKFNANKRTNTVLTQAFLAARHGQQLEFRWALIRDGKEIARSGPLVLNVKRIAEGDARFPTPVIAGQTRQELDVTKLVATDTLSIAPWPLQQWGHFVWLRYDGFNNIGTPVFFDDLKGVPHNEMQGLSRQIPLEWLKTLGNGKELSISFKTTLSGHFDEGAVVTFPVRRYLVKVVPAISDLIIDTSALHLSGRNIMWRLGGVTLTGNDPSGTSAQRQVSGGEPPYNYRSSNPAIASVDKQTGKIRSTGNGNAVIEVFDESGQSKSFSVYTSNVVEAARNPPNSNLNFDQAIAWILSNGTPFTVADLPILQIKYTSTTSLSNLTAGSGSNAYVFKNLSSVNGRWVLRDVARHLGVTVAVTLRRF